METPNPTDLKIMTSFSWKDIQPNMRDWIFRLGIYDFTIDKINYTEGVWCNLNRRKCIEHTPVNFQILKTKINSQVLNYKS